MSTLTIVMETNLELAKSILGKIYFSVYKAKVKSLMKIMTTRLKKYETDESSKNKRIFVQEGEDEYIQKEKKKLEEFLFSDSKLLENNEEIQKMKNDRIVMKIVTWMRKANKKIKANAIKASLGKNSVLEFFNSLGITVKWMVEKKQNI